jgi:NAD(P)-dependent dehydrogenase (short-subunit alcohol dehydrogenase family)
MGRLCGKVALVTGAGEGMGRAGARLFAREGASVGVLDIDQERARATAEIIAAEGGRAIELVADVARAVEVEAAMKQIVQEFSALHVLYNNAGIWHPGDGTVTELDLHAWERTLAVNLTGVFLCCRYGLPELVRSGGGSVINTASPVAIRPEPGSDAYVASKGGVLSLTRAIAQAYAGAGIRANVLMPGVTETPLVWEALNASGFRDYVTRMTPLGRLGQPDDIAHAALYLASDESSFVTGSVHWADGGWDVGGRGHET